MRYIFVPLGIAIMCSSVGCHAVSGWTPTNAPPHPLHAKDVSQVELYTAASPDKEFVEVGIISSAPGFVSADSETLLQLRKEGAERGCDGLVVTDTTTYGSASNTALGVQYSEKKGFQAACIVYK